MKPLVVRVVVRNEGEELEARREVTVAWLQADGLADHDRGDAGQRAHDKEGKEAEQPSGLIEHVGEHDHGGSNEVVDMQNV